LHEIFDLKAVLPNFDLTCMVQRGNVTGPFVISKGIDSLSRPAHDAGLPKRRASIFES